MSSVDSTVRGIAKSQGVAHSTILRAVRKMEAEYGVTLLVPGERPNELMVDVKALKRIVDKEPRRIPRKQKSVRGQVLLL